MSQQGGSPTASEDDWWQELYDASTDDTGPTPAPDSLDDRFASAAGTVAPGEAATGPTQRADPAADRVTGTRGGAHTVVPARTPGGGRPGARTPVDRRPGDAPSVDRRPGDAPSVGRRSGDAPPADRTAATGTVRPLTERAGPEEPPGSPGPPHPPARPSVPAARPGPDHFRDGPPAHDADPAALPPADPDALTDLVPDTVLDGARYGTCTLRAASVRGDSARLRGEPRRDVLLTARFGPGEQGLVLVAMASGVPGTPDAHGAAAELCHAIGRAVGHHHARLAQDMRAGLRDDLKSGLHRLTDRSLGRLRAAGPGADPAAGTAGLRCLLLPADPRCRTRVFFGVGEGGLFRLRDGRWQDLEPDPGTGGPPAGHGSPPPEAPAAPGGTRAAGPDHNTMDLGIPTPAGPCERAPAPPPRGPFRFRASVARPGDTLLMCTAGLAAPLREETGLAAHLTERWSAPTPPGLAGFLADTQVRVRGYADDRTAAALWEV